MCVTLARGGEGEEIIFGQFAVYQDRPRQEALLLNRAEDIFPDYIVGKDGVAFLLPADQIEIVRTSKGRQVLKGKIRTRAEQLTH